MRATILGQKLALLRASQLHLIVDFDRTLTHPDGETSWGCLKASRQLSRAFHEGSAALYRKYHPMEVNGALPLEERVLAMEKWWDEAHRLLLSERVTRDTFARMIEEDKHQLYWREGTRELMDMCKKEGIPVLIFSAGLGDLIDAAIAKEDWGAHVISNHLVFDSGGVATGFKHRNIHTFSKSEVLLKEVHEEWGKEVEERRNVILIGDSLGGKRWLFCVCVYVFLFNKAPPPDKDMANGIPHDVVLKIAFLNQENLGSRDEYEREFDLVIENDPTMNKIIELIKGVINTE